MMHNRMQGFAFRIRISPGMFVAFISWYKQINAFKPAENSAPFQWIHPGDPRKADTSYQHRIKHNTNYSDLRLLIGLTIAAFIA
jgi:hypothetical protein